MKSAATFTRLLAFTTVLLTLAVPAAAVQSLMRTDGVNGPIIHDGQPGWFKINSFTWGTATGPAPGNRPARSGPGTFSFTKGMDSASTGLMQRCSGGQSPGKAEIAIQRASGNKWEKYLIFSLQMTECPEPDMPGLEHYTFQYRTIAWERGLPDSEKESGKWKRAK